MKRRVERFASAGHRIEDGQQLARASGDGELLGLACGEQALVSRAPAAAVDNSTELPPHLPSPTTPQPSATTFITP